MEPLPLNTVAGENALIDAFPFVEWRHGYAFFLQIQRFHVAKDENALGG
jgi:hypothetical protein